MANTLLTIDMITREALRVLHQKLNFIGTINRQYDDSFAKRGAKIGDTLRIRLPNQYVIRTGATLTVQDTVEQNTSLTVATQKGVDLNFTSLDLTLKLDDFSKRILNPAMAVLAANVEADAMTMYKDVYQQVNNLAAPLTFGKVQQGRKVLVDSLAPLTDRTANLNTQDNVDLIDSVKGLFHDSEAIKKQYREGMSGRTGGFDFYENTLWPRHLSGTNAGTGYLVNGAGQTGSSLIVDTGTGTFTKGDVFTIAGVNRVHPETKVDTGVLQQFVVTANYAGGGGTVSIAPAIVVTGGRQNVTQSPPDNNAITKIGGNASTYGISLLYNEDAFTFATADLVVPNGVDMAAREVYDGISMRIVRDYTISDDNFPCRVDILYGYKAIRPELAVRSANN
jgi:hypothetical protein